MSIFGEEKEGLNGAYEWLRTYVAQSDPENISETIEDVLQCVIYALKELPKK